MIGINIGSFLTKFSCGDIIHKNKEVYNYFDFKLNPLLNDHLERVLESIIQYKEKSILFASSTYLGYKKYCTSTFNNLSRLIGFMFNISKINDEEKKYFLVNDNYDKEKGTFKFKFNNISYEITGDDCVCSYLKKIDEKIKTKLKTNEKQKYIFSVPDYYSYYQKEALKIILQSLNLDNEYPFINESTALTMYYGYLNYKELTNEKKYVIFVDIGHSKTSFILSEFTKKEFIVKEVENIPFLGGRDFNDRIFERCLEYFEKENNKSLEVNGKNKYKLYDEIEKARKNLTINDSALINIDALEGDIDFSMEITKEEFEKLIKKEKKQFNNKFKLFYNKVKKNQIWRIEMGGQLMRTPILEEIIHEISNIKLSKTIALDECHSLGTLLYTLFIIEKNKFEELNKVSSYDNNNYLKYHINRANIVISILNNNNYSKEGYRYQLGNLKDLSNELYINFFYKKGNDFLYQLYNYNIKRKKKKFDKISYLRYKKKKRNKKTQLFLNSENTIYIIIKKIKLDLPKESNNINEGYQKENKRLKLVKRTNFKNEDYQLKLKKNQDIFNKNY